MIRLKKLASNSIIGKKDDMPSLGCIQNNTHHYLHYVPFSETDAGGIVYHGRYADIAERARNALLLLLPSFDDNFEEGEKENSKFLKDFGFIVHSLSANYKKPVKLNEIVRIESNVLELKPASMLLTQRFFVGNELRTELTLKLVTINSTFQPSKIPSYWAERFNCLIKKEK
ncbi:MAG: acyl-CoA thioesterase [Rickettsiales bacterium]|jgi:acyl-CoA thioester hydrolase|nr:acyl-CoA thioesterase [Rickettsiales bacterium]